MSRSRVLRGVVPWMLAAALLLAFALPVFAQDDEGAEDPNLTTEAPLNSPDGVYAVVGTTNTGARVSTNVLVRSIGDAGDKIQFSAKVKGVPIATSGLATWNSDHMQVTVPISVYVIGLADAEGTITLEAAQAGWEFSGSGSGTVVGASGSAMAAGFMPGGMPSSRELVTETTGVSESMQSADDALSILLPGDETGDLDSDAALQEMAAILFGAFFMIVMQMILKTAIW